jgi:hypothetical protein
MGTKNLSLEELNQALKDDLSKKAKLSFEEIEGILDKLQKCDPAYVQNIDVQKAWADFNKNYRPSNK